MPRFGPPTLGRWPHFKHPLSTSVALLVLPWLGFLLNTWLGVLVGIAMYVGSRTFAPAESLKILWL